ncbi:MAG: hypothetical protein M1423_06275 [Acidobacteria bacterium]|nr:hypothetical protein [Acidobacteriota bacterium]
MRGKVLRMAAFLVLTALVAGSLPLRAAIKLYLKDGTYELVKSYELQGDRVRYYSLERSDWEEVPKSLVDFEATKRAQAEEKTQQENQLEQARKIENERFEIPQNNGYEIEKGIRLPTEPGVYAFDGLRVIHLIQSTGREITDKTRNAVAILMPAPLLKKETLIVLPGAKAAVRISNPQPRFFVEDSDPWASTAQLLPLEKRKDSRIVEKLRSGIGVGKSGEVREALPLSRTRLAAGLYELKPTRPLPTGEYALGELLGEKLNINVWDFGIEPTAVK